MESCPQGTLSTVLVQEYLRFYLVVPIALTTNGALLSAVCLWEALCLITHRLIHCLSIQRHSDSQVVGKMKLDCWPKHHMNGPKLNSWFFLCLWNPTSLVGLHCNIAPSTPIVYAPQEEWWSTWGPLQPKTLNSSINPLKISSGVQAAHSHIYLIHQ